MMKVKRFFALAPIIFLAAISIAQAAHQQVGEPLDLGALELVEVYSNGFSGADRIEFEADFVADGRRTGLPDPGAEWIAEGQGGAQVCAGKLWVAPVAFEACGVPLKEPGLERSHMVVWNKNRFPADMLFEFTVNHHGSDDGLTLVFFSATGLEGQGIFDPGLPSRMGVYRNYNKGELKNYTVSYWSRNKKPSLVERGEAYSNRIRKNPGANILATNASLTDKCNDCDYRVRVLKIGGRITAEINGKVVNQADDPDPYAGGFIGLRSMQGVDKVSYDDFRVWSVHTGEAPVPGNAFMAGSQEEFIARAEKVRAGDAIIIRNGTYENWSVSSEIRGDEDNPVVIRPESPGGVVFTANGVLQKPMFDFRGGHFDFDGFTFRDIVLDTSLVNFVSTEGARFINNDLGNLEGSENIGRLVSLLGGSADNVVANNTFHDCENVLVVTIRMRDDHISRRPHVHHNVFKDLNTHRGGEGTTTLQLASSGRFPYEQLLMEAVVEHNYFENIAGDAETLSNKSNGNIIRNNTFLGTRSLVIRQGHNVTVEGNVLVNTSGPAIRVHGSGHTVSGNTIESPQEHGIALVYGMGSGLEARTHRVAATGGTYAGNVIRNAGAHGIFLGYGKGTDHTGHKREREWNTGVLQDIPPSGNVITGNIITGSKLAPIEIAGAEDNTID